jgi:DNA repair exonuclease SbcCD nuclease subunit
MSDLKQFKVDSKYINYNNIFLIADLHFGVRANSLEWLSNQMNYFENFYIPYLKKNIKPNDILFILGDVHDNRQAIDITILNSTISIIEKLAKIIPIYIILGNHDCGKKYDTDVNSTIAFKYIPNVTIYEKPLVITNNETSILLLPWIGNKDAEENYIRANKFDYVFAHASISGFKYDNGRDIKASNCANLFKFKSIKRLFSGHIHKRQELNNFIYIGSPYHMKRSDIGNSKGLYLFNPKENSFSFTLNDYSPIFQRILLENILELSLSDAIKLLNNNYTDIIVPDKYIHLFNLTKFVEILKDCNYKKIETVAERKRTESELSDALEGIDIKDILTLLDMSITDLGYPREVQTKLKSLNRDYYEKAGKDEIE